MVAVSAGNTGALMAMSKFCLRTMANIERPAIAAIWPTMRGESVVLDVGATIGADAQQLIDFALLGGAMARAVVRGRAPDRRIAQHRCRGGQGPGGSAHRRAVCCARPLDT
jgi:glycerol-3-phosphate acyltransferase PlsX